MVRRDDIDSLFNEEDFSIDLDNEAVLKEIQARSEALDRVAEFCNLDRQDPQIHIEVMGMRLPAYNAPASTALSLAEYIDNYPRMPEGARAVMLLLKLDIISCLNYAWREAHNKMLLRRSIALDCLRRTLPPIDDDQKLALLHAPFKGTTLFGGELSKLQEANTKRAATFTVFPQPTAPLNLIPLDRMSDEVGV